MTINQLEIMIQNHQDMGWESATAASSTSSLKTNILKFLEITW